MVVTRYCLNSGRCAVVTVARGALQPVCRCQEGYRGARCELKHVNSSIPVATVTLVIGAVIILIIIIGLVVINKRFSRFESILLATDKQRQHNGVLGQKLLGQQQAMATLPQDTSTYTVTDRSTWRGWSSLASIRAFTASMARV